MSALEVVGFIFALEPLLTRAQDLAARCRKYKSNREILKERHLFTALRTQLSTTVPELEHKASNLPSSTRDIINTDVQTLLELLQRALQHASFIDSYSEKRVKQFFRANSLSGELTNLSQVLENAKTVVQQSRRFKEIMKTLCKQQITETDSTSDQFQAYFPSCRDAASVALNFDAFKDDGGPATVEARIKKLVTMEHPQNPRIIAIHGAGGVGKSTILAGLARDPCVQRVFPDGVHVMKLGMDATRATLLYALRKTLRDSGGIKKVESESLNTSENIFDAIDALISWFDGKRCGIFVDDVWSRKIGVGVISRLCELGSTNSKSCIVITTREHKVAAIGPQESIICVEKRDRYGADSRSILFLHAEMGDTEARKQMEGPINQVLSVCDGLPVLLSAAGKSV